MRAMICGFARADKNFSRPTAAVVYRVDRRSEGLVGTVGRGKGSLLIHTRDYVVRGRGQSTWMSILAEASPSDRAVLDSLLLAGSWYPIGVVNRVVARYCKSAASPDEEMRKLSAYIADTDLGTVYKMLLRFGSPELLVKRTGSLWNRYFDVGQLTPTELGPKHWQLRLVMPLEEDRAPNKLFCGPGAPAWIEMGLGLTGATSARVQHVECRFQNREHCTYDVTW
jgi:hypothetical protein